MAWPKRTGPLSQKQRVMLAIRRKKQAPQMMSPMGQQSMQSPMMPDQTSIPSALPTGLGYNKGGQVHMRRIHAGLKKMGIVHDKDNDGY